MSSRQGVYVETIRPHISEAGGSVGGYIGMYVDLVKFWRNLLPGHVQIANTHIAQKENSHERRRQNSPYYYAILFACPFRTLRIN